MLQLIYMWIEDYREILKEVNLNFHSNFEFEFKKDENDKNKGLLRIKKFNPNDEFINEYFPKNQFISLIVGKNGTGKTSVFDLLYEGISTKRRYFLIFLEKIKEDEDEKYKLYIWGAKFLNLDDNSIFLKNVCNLTEIDLELPNKNQIENPIERPNYLDEFPNLSLYYFTSEFDKEEPNPTFVTFYQTKDFSSYTTNFYDELEKVDSKFNYMSCKDKYNFTKYTIDTDLWINFFKHISYLERLSNTDENIKIPNILIFSLRSLEVYEERELIKQTNIDIEVLRVNWKSEENLKRIFKEIHQNIQQNDVCIEIYLLRMFQWYKAVLNFYGRNPTKEKYLAILKTASFIFHLFHTYKNIIEGKLSDNFKETFIRVICNRLSNIGQEIANIQNGVLETYIQILFDKLKRKIIVVDNDQNILISFWNEFFENIERIVNIINEMLSEKNNIKYKIHFGQLAVGNITTAASKLEELANVLKGMFFTQYPLILLGTVPPLSSG